MAIIHNLGFPRIGKNRELKKALESFWTGDISQENLNTTGASIRKENLTLQNKLDYIPVNDFSYYDHILDCSVMLGNIPGRFQTNDKNSLDTYFHMARGSRAGDPSTQCCQAKEMTKWFDTNYHYLVPEFHSDTRFSTNPKKLFDDVSEAKTIVGSKTKPVLIGPVSYLKLGKEKDGANKIDLLQRLLPAYQFILHQLARQGIEWVQIDEPIFVTDLNAEWKDAIRTAYEALSTHGVKILLATYFGPLGDNLDLAASLPVHGIHLDAVRGAEDIHTLADTLSPEKVLSLGVIDGRNVWKSDLESILNLIEPLSVKLRNRLWIAPSCSLLHVPISLEEEAHIDPEIRNWMAFATEKISELELIGKALNEGRATVKKELESNARALQARIRSPRIHNPSVKLAIENLNPSIENRQSCYTERIKKQQTRFNLPLFPTTTIGSFPQTRDIRKLRSAYRKKLLDEDTYIKAMEKEISHVIDVQEKIGLDVLVHGEAERNDMVEYFGEQLYGFAFTSHGWVQSYGSRCVKPPILYGDIRRQKAMTVRWSQFAQSLTKKPVKGMLTGPVTILNWSFVRDDQPRQTTCEQLALAIREEVLDLEKAGIGIIQIDEAALREGLPLRKSQWDSYLKWAIRSFKIAANGVRNETQIHTHMCYSEFNDIIASIAAMDTDVITIENSRSQSELLKIFDTFSYPNEIGPGVYDIHSPAIPSVEHITGLIEQASQRIPAQRLWINPDCGLKTRQWEDVVPSLVNMVEAAGIVRKQHKKSPVRCPA